MIDGNAVLEVERLSERGEGVAQIQDDTLFVPYTLPGEKIRAERDGANAKIIDVLKASPDRITPFCQYFGVCGGCALQMRQPCKNLQWKRENVAHALKRSGVDARVAETIDAHGEGRRRVVFHARYDQNRAIVGFMKARSHALTEIDHCPLLTKRLQRAPEIARSLANILRPIGKPLDLAMTATDEGLDVDLRGCGPLEEGLRQLLIVAAQSLDLARLSNHGLLIVAPRAPSLTVGPSRVKIPAGGFLQATALGERILGDFVISHAADGKRAADFFCGIGPFALRMAKFCDVDAFEEDEVALACLDRAYRETKNLRRLRLDRRDLFRRPLNVEALNFYDLIVLDPPRAGAEKQCREIAASRVAKIVSLSCDPASFARDAAILTAGGYRLETVVPIDQFRESPHVEIMAYFARLPEKRPRRPLLSR